LFEVRGVGGLALEGVSVAVVIGVAAAPAAPTVRTAPGMPAVPAAGGPATATTVDAVVVVGSMSVWLDDNEGVVGEVSSGEDAVHHVNSVFGAVEQDGDRVKICNSKTFVKGGLPEGGYVVTACDCREVVAQAVGHNWPKKVVIVHSEGGGDLGDFGPSLLGVGQEDVEHEVDVDPLVIVGPSAFTHLKGTRGDGEL